MSNDEAPPPDADEPRGGVATSGPRDAGTDADEGDDARDGDPRSHESDAALGRYAGRMRRQRRRYYVTLGVVVVLALVWVVVMWERGEISHVTLKTAARPAPSVTLQAPAGTQTKAWSSGDHTALGTPYWHGTVVTYSRHTVSGRNALTGAVTWSYDRSDRSVCAAAQIQGVTVSVYRVGGDCQEVTALDSDTGKRVWTRTLFENAEPITGTPTFSMNANTLMITSPTAVYAIAPSVGQYNNGIDRWVFAQQGCRINSAIYGSNGALISQTCTDRDCSGLKYCANGTQLLLRDPLTGQSDQDKDKANPDMIKWLRSNTTAVPVSADGVVSAYEPASGTLDAYNTDTGAPVGTYAMPARQATTTLSAQACDRGELIWIGGRLRLVASGGTSVIWTSGTVAPPTVTVTQQTDAFYPPLANSLLVAPTASTGVSLLDGSSGDAGRDVVGPVVPRGSTAWPLGAGILVAGSTTTYYR